MKAKPTTTRSCSFKQCLAILRDKCYKGVLSYEYHHTKCHPS